MSLNPAITTGRRSGFVLHLRLFFLCLIVFLFSAGISFWYFFPAELVQQRLVKEASRQTGLRMESDQARLTFPLGLELDLTIYPQVEEMNPVKLDLLKISPAWMKLVSGSPAIALQGELAGGQFSGEADASGQVNLSAQNLAVEQLESDTLPYRVTGRLQADLQGEQLTSARDGEGTFNLRLSTATLLGLDRIGLDENFSLGTLEASGKFTQRRLSLEKLVMVGGQLEMSGGGTVMIGNTPQQTRLNLNIRFHPTQTTPPGLTDLINISGLKPSADGSYTLRVGGSLARPQVR